MYPLPVHAGEVGGPDGYTYAAVLIRPGARGEVLDALREIRFSGWLTRPEDGWLIAVASSGDGTVAAGRRGVVGVGEWLAGRLNATVLAVRVLRDRQLVLVAWAGGVEVGRYVSDPSVGQDPDDDVLPEPVGAGYATAFAAICGYPEAAEDLAGLLSEELDPGSAIESERLGAVLRLLNLPTWLVAAASLPRDVPTGPRAAELTRLGAGVPGLPGWVGGRAVDVVRRRRPPPPAVTDPPRGSGDVDPWLL